MKVYIDNDYKCYTEPKDGLIEVKSSFFDNKVKEYIEGSRYVPYGKTWIRDDGVEFIGEMIAPWKDWNELDIFQRDYEREEFTKLATANQELTNTIAAMVDEVYASDVAMIKED